MELINIFYEYIVFFYNYIFDFNSLTLILTIPIRAILILFFILQKLYLLKILTALIFLYILYAIYLKIVAVLL